MAARLPVCARSLMQSVGVAIVGVVGFSFAHSTTAQSSRILFSESFDDDPLGACPYGSASATSSPAIHSAVGFMAGNKTPGETALNVIRLDANLTNNCLSLIDYQPGPGGVQTTLFPNGAAPGSPTYIAFTLRRIDSDSSSNFECCAIDNRTTPGTGRLATMSLYGSDGMLKVGNAPTSYRVGLGVPYRIEMSLSFQPGKVGTWRVKVTNLDDPADVYAACGLRMLCDGTDVTSFQYSLTSIEHAAYTVDDMTIEAL